MTLKYLSASTVVDTAEVMLRKVKSLRICKSKLSMKNKEQLIKKGLIEKGNRYNLPNQLVQRTHEQKKLPN